jgi:hypothetical protein
MEVIKMSKFKENDRVVIAAGDHAGEPGVFDGTEELCYVKTDSGYRVLLHESDLYFEDLMNEPADEPVYTEQDELQFKLECIRNNLEDNGIVLTEGTDLLDYSYYYEMAGRIPGELRVGKKGILIVAMGANEDRGEAHFHIFRNKNDWKAWKNGACLLFKENKYFDHANNRETLTRDEMKTLVECLKSKPADDLPGDTYWQFLIYLWNQNNYDFRINIDTPMPDYNYDTITRYKG